MIDDQDSQREQYEHLYGDEVYVFNKAEAEKTTTAMDNFGEMKSIVFAHNACFGIAAELGYDYFVQLDDDYTSFGHRHDKEFKAVYRAAKDLDSVFESFLEFFDSTPIHSIAMAQGGDFIGGSDVQFEKQGIRMLRKCMNSFICSTKRPFKFLGLLNDDVNTYVTEGIRGRLMFTALSFSLSQKATQSGKGGVTDIYLKYGTYVKSFYTVMLAPSCVKVAPMGDKHYRLHHRVSWNNAVPKIMRENIRN